MSDLEPLSPTLRALFEEERASYLDDPARQLRVERRLEAAIVLGAAAAAGLSASARGASGGALANDGVRAVVHGVKHAKVWIAVSLVAGIGVGETHARLTRDTSMPAVATSTAHALDASSSSSSSSTSSAPSLEIASPPPSLPSSSATAPFPVPSHSPSAAASAPSPKSESRSELAAEQSLIDTARAALARGRGEDALHAADEHAQRFPRGSLAEERETLAIQALLLIGRRADAEARAQRFHRLYPESLYGSAVDALVRVKDDHPR